jgi:ABC-type Fe3+/spermidine/putrescine transport system ATPase subunit
MNLIEVSGICRQEEGKCLLRNVSFVQKPSQKLAIAGATGAGKTTLLKIIAGLTEPTEGVVRFNNEKVKAPNEQLIPGHPSIAYLSQYFELRNHYRVEELLEMTCKVTQPEADKVYQVCRIDHLLKRWTHQLSGGEKQRIALARLLVISPKLLLLDEPYSNLDPFHKATLKEVINDLSEQLHMTCTLVSHDPADTLSWADEIIVLKEGEFIQKGTPEKIYRKPVDEYVAALFGPYNKLSDSLQKMFDEFLSVKTNGTIPFIRPESLRLVNKGMGVRGEVNKVNFKGNFYEVEVRIGGERLLVFSDQEIATNNKEVFIALWEMKNPDL